MRYSPEDRIELVLKCILDHHRGSINNNRNNIEKKIIAETSVMSNFDNITRIFKATFVYEGLVMKKQKGSSKRNYKTNINS